MGDNVIQRKSFQLAIRIINLYKVLSNDRKEFIMSKQLLRSGTSVGANTREAQNAQSKADFVHKLSISQKECDETIYWLELLNETEYITKKEFDEVCGLAEENLKIIRSIIIYNF